MPANTAGYIYRLVKKMTGPSKHTTAQHLVNKCKQYRRFHKADFTKQFHRLRNAVLAVLAKANEASTNDEVSDIFCGPSLHTSNTELYFPDTTYTAAALTRMAMCSGTNFLSTTPVILEKGHKLGDVPWICAPCPLKRQ